jgi:hypothetical protein
MEAIIYPFAKIQDWAIERLCRIPLLDEETQLRLKKEIEEVIKKNSL